MLGMAAGRLWEYWPPPAPAPRTGSVCCAPPSPGSAPNSSGTSRPGSSATDTSPTRPNSRPHQPVSDLRRARTLDMSRDRPRSGRVWRLERDAVRARAAALGEPCGICGHPIDVTLKYPRPSVKHPRPHRRDLPRRQRTRPGQPPARTPRPPPAQVRPVRATEPRPIRERHRALRSPHGARTRPESSTRMVTEKSHPQRDGYRAVSDAISARYSVASTSTSMLV